jgi:cytochrome c oxidase cbb3-type subunit 2
MSEALAAAAAAMGIPEALVERSAEARAGESGASVEDVLTQWAGGEAAPVTAASAVAEPVPEAAEAQEAPTEAPAEPAPAPEPAPEIVIETPAAAATTPAEPVPAGPFKPPVLVGATDSPMTVLAAVVGLFAIVVLVGLVGPSIPTDIAGARTSEIDYSEAALSGQEIYREAGCASCHTQMVRPMVADVGLGPVTLNDTNQVLGTRRFGPDLSDVGSRLTPEEIRSKIEGSGGHPAQSLAGENLDDLVAYLTESSTSTPTEEES